MMINGFRQMPELLQKQVIIRLAFGTVSIVLFAALLIYTGDIFLTLPFLGMAAFFLAAAFALFRRVVLGEYVVVSGKCTGACITMLKRRTRHFVLQTDACSLKVVLRGRLRKIPPGTEVKLYIAKNASIYDQSGMQVLYSYLAIEVHSGGK